MKIRLVWLFLLLFLVFPVTTYAKDVNVSGKLLDQKNNPIPRGVVVFVNTSGKTIAATSTDFAGSYEVLVPQGTYTISANGAKGTNIKGATLNNQKIASLTTFNFTLTTPDSLGAKKPSFLRQYSPIIVVSILILFLALGGYIFWRKKKNTPKPPSEVSSV